MQGRGTPRHLSDAVATVRSRISKYRDSKGFNEQNTKASLILPVLEALGWNPNDPEDVQKGSVSQVCDPSSKAKSTGLYRGLGLYSHLPGIGTASAAGRFVEWR